MALVRSGEIDEPVEDERQCALDCCRPPTGGTILVSGVWTFAAILRLAAFCQQRRDNQVFAGRAARGNAKPWRPRPPSDSPSFVRAAPATLTAIREILPEATCTTQNPKFRSPKHSHQRRGQMEPTAGAFTATEQDRAGRAERIGHARTGGGGV
jgi:hypothetical protein